jgi:aspartyl-tRNA(Asn)/glutamyl-tRNA(Gln) amidotransferase subunit A
MKTASAAPAGELAAMEAALAATTMRLHGIASRTSAAQIAAEVLRLNDAVREGAAGRISSASQPADFGALLLAGADPCNAEDAS